MIGRSKYLAQFHMTEEDCFKKCQGSYYVNDDVCDIASSYDTVISKLMRVGG